MNKTNQREYELTIITPSSTKDKTGEKIVNDLEEVIEKIGQLNKKEEWGLKELAYPIQDHQRAYYTFFDFAADPGKISQLDKQLDLEENIIRQLLIVKED